MTDTNHIEPCPFRASAGEGGDAAAWMIRNIHTGRFYWDEEECIFSDSSSAELYAEYLNDAYDSDPWEVVPLYTAAPQPAQAGASGGGDDWRETERLRLLKLRQLLEGFEVEIEAEGLESPATYLDRVTLVGRFQPSAGGPEVAKRIAAILAAPVRDATPASPATVQGEHVRKLVGKLDQWRMCMSHNESYFGEPAGLMKATIAELAKAVDPIYPPKPEPVDPLAGVAIYTDTVPLTATPLPAQGEGNNG